MEQQLKPTILFIDSNESILLSLEKVFIKLDYQVIKSINANSAKELINKYYDKINALIINRKLSDIDGIKIVNWMNNQANLANIPVIMYTDSDNLQGEQEIWNSGVFSCLKKPLQENMLKSVVASAVQISKQNRFLNLEINSHKSSFKLVSNIAMHIQTITEAENSARFIASCFPDSGVMLSAIAELVINSVEHGLLGVSYEEKTKLVENGKWRGELDRLSKLPENKNRMVELYFQREHAKYSIKISDPGKGFAWQKYLNSDPARGLDNHGRGIARANMSFSSVQYNKTGNQVLAILDQSDVKTIQW